jgi:hypothetical protein
MTENRAAPRAGTTRHEAGRRVAGSALLMIGLLLAGCSPNPNAGPGGSRLRTYAADVTGGAKVCEAPNLSPAAGQTTEAAIKVANDGGWCGLVLHQDGPKPYDAGLLTARAAHGNVTIHRVGDDTRIDYTPDRGFTGSDSFAVKLIPGDGTIHAAVTVTAPAPQK